MSKRNFVSVTLGACAVAALLSTGGDRAWAEKSTRDLNATTWSTAGKLKFGGSGISNETAEAAGAFIFGPLAIPVVVGDFSMVLSYATAGGPGELTVEGQYALVKPGKPSFIIDRRALQEQFGGDSYITDTDLKAKLKTVKGVDTLQVKMKVKLEECAFDSSGKARCSKTTLSYKGEGGLAPP